MRYLISMGCALVLAAGCANKEKTIRPEMKELTEAVYASGTLIPEQEYKVVSMMDGFITNIAFKEGDAVGCGQTLLQVSNASRRAQEEAAKQLVQTTAPVAADDAPQVRDIRNRIQAAMLRKKNDSIQYVRYRNLYDEHAISRSAYERYELAYETSSKEVSALRQQLKSAELSADIQLQQARNQLTLSRADASNSVVKSQLNGVLYELYRKQGDYVNVNQPVALIGAGNMIAKLLVDEDDFSKVYKGQKVLLSMDAKPGKIYTAHVEKIYPSLSKAEQSFRVDAIIKDTADINLYGANLEANLIVAENKRVLAIPREALLKGDSVWVEREGKKQLVKIVKGVQDSKWVEVKQGLDSSSIIIVE